MASTSSIEIQEMKERVKTMLKDSIVAPLTSQCCIFRVPEVLRKMKESAYTPLVISIGPFHHKKNELQFMEKQKVRYLNHVLQVYKEVNLDTLLTFIKGLEMSVRESYGEVIELRSDDFLMMLLLDGVFIVEYFRRNAFPGLKDQNDKVLYKPKLRHSIGNDLILLENQLPFFFLESLYKLLSPKISIQLPTFLQISCHFFNDLNEQKITPPAKVLHFTDLIRTFHLHRRNVEPIHQESNEETEHISLYSAKELEESGINFNHRKNNEETHPITNGSAKKLSGINFNHRENNEETHRSALFSGLQLSGTHSNHRENNEETHRSTPFSGLQLFGTPIIGLQLSGTHSNHRENNEETHRSTPFSGLQLSGTFSGLKLSGTRSNHRENNEETNHIAVYSAEELDESGINFNHLENKEETDHISVYSAKELEESGIHFEADGSCKCLLDIKFKVNDGVFLIPRLSIEDGTEGMFRNIMALEQHMYMNGPYICDYVALMDTLIDTYKDVELLVQKRILSNYMGDHEEVVALFNNLGREIIHDRKKSHYSNLIHDLDKYYKKPQHKWRASLIRDYFSTPWQIASVIAATILLVLTLLQTIKAF